MIKEHLQHISGVEIYAIVGFIIFFAFFILITIHTLRMKKNEVDRYSHIPLEDELNNHLE
ncbi:CcoQ/FixQ family Cbb3-type cytochrome c oxidase assembly chaperone [Sunxiuqinia sp. A32]|uniref:CcoQ/FixQ family Cbb3-type cytochrome c oxidase assembly chaperone n=1 Tax=Sunxiuqinia sp. A32 TaxID=3461496 RepID=UPI0040463C30